MCQSRDPILDCTACCAVVPTRTRLPHDSATNALDISSPPSSRHFLPTRTVWVAHCWDVDERRVKPGLERSRTLALVICHHPSSSRRHAALSSQDLQNIIGFAEHVQRENLSPESVEAARSLDATLANLTKNFSEGIDFFQLLVAVFQARASSFPPPRPCVVASVLSLRLLRLFGSTLSCWSGEGEGEGIRKQASEE